MSSNNIHLQTIHVTQKDREKIKDQEGMVVWLTGLSGSGKSTLANKLEMKLNELKKHTYILDGDNLRLGLNKDLSFDDQDRIENIRRVAEVARLMMDAGLIVITALISPFSADRKMAKELIGSNHYVEVFVDTPLNICELRDPKGLYQKARKGLIKNMTGIDSPYEAPMNPDVHYKEDSQIHEIINLVIKNKY